MCWGGGGRGVEVRVTMKQMKKLNQRLALNVTIAVTKGVVDSLLDTVLKIQNSTGLGCGFVWRTRTAGC